MKFFVDSYMLDNLELCFVVMHCNGTSICKTKDIMLAHKICEMLQFNNTTTKHDLALLLVGYSILPHDFLNPSILKGVKKNGSDKNIMQF